MIFDEFDEKKNFCAYSQGKLKTFSIRITYPLKALIFYFDMENTQKIFK